MFRQFIKFLIVGINNTGLDFLILNLLMLSFNVYKGLPLIFFNIVSFSIAVTNSYLINRFWTFKIEEDKKIRKIQLLLVLIIFFILLNLKFVKINFLFITLTTFFLVTVLLIDFYVIKKFLLKEKFSKSSIEFSKFVLLTLIGMSINTGIFYSFTSFFSPFFGFSKVLWANFSKAIATIASLFWNFGCYKFVVFKK